MRSADLHISRMTRASALNKRFQALSSELSVCEEHYLSKVERAALHQIVVLQKLRNVSSSHGMITQGFLKESNIQANTIPATTAYQWYDVRNSTNGDSLSSGTQIPAAAAALPAASQIHPSTSDIKGKSSVPSPMEVTSDASPTQQRLERELIDKRFSHFRFVRAPADYYDHPLEFRMQCLQATSIHHLCKSMIMENTRAPESVDGFRDPLNSRYYTVIVQYTAKISSDKIDTFVCRSLNKGGLSKKNFNFRLAPEHVSDALSGFSHNAVTPIGSVSQLPIILSHRIAQLAQPSLIWIGGGEVDLKVGFHLADFLAGYSPFVADCTYNASDHDRENGESS